MNINNLKMMLSRFSFPPLSLSLIAEFARNVVMRCTTRPQVCGLIVLLAELTLAPVGMAAGVQRSLSRFEQEVVSPIWAEHQVLRAVVRSDVVPVVDFFGAREVATEDAFDYENVLVDVPACVRSGVFGCAFLNVASHEGRPTLPVRTLFPARPAPMVFVEHQGLASARSERSRGLLSDRSGQPATTLTKTRRINHTRAQNVCADQFNQSNTFGGLT